MATQNYCGIYIVSAWISDPFFNTSVHDHFILYLQTTLSEHWTFRIQNYSLTNFGSRLFGIRWCVQLQNIGTTESVDHTEAFLPCGNRMLDVLVAPIIDESLNASLQSCIVLPSKDIYEEPFGYHSGNCSPIILEKRIQILFWEYTQPLVLYWLYKARYCNLPHTIKIPSLVDDGEYRFTLMMMDFNALFNIYA